MTPWLLRVLDRRRPRASVVRAPTPNPELLAESRRHTTLMARAERVIREQLARDRLRRAAGAYVGPERRRRPRSAP